MTAPNLDESALSIPWEGVRELFHSWSGKGDLFAGLAAVLRNDEFSRWTKRDVERRAHRVLFENCCESLQRMPIRVRDWLAIVPVHSQVSHAASPAPRGRIDWAATRRTGWPPREFVGRTRQRTSDEALLSALRWTVERMLLVYLDASFKDLRRKKPLVEEQLDALGQLVERPELQQVPAVLPDWAVIKDFRRSGPKWQVVADLADVLRKEEGPDLIALAKAQIMPDEELASALFHLGVFGLVLTSLRADGHRPVSLRPLHGGASGAAYEVEAAGQIWHLWFEAGGLWAKSGQVEPYVEATRGLRRPGQTKSPDIMLVNEGSRRALIIECKYSKDHKYIRSGYSQALTYLTEARTTMIDIGAAFVVAPSEMVATLSTGRTVMGPVSFCAPEHFKGAFRTAFAELRR
ncbi:hypothetical protein [Amycolatopsis sp. NPDC004625]|uniref:hypothetical protein n=1 Tax=Amycolatopsis sp. NPDC004625 TaxID=3154670 RepID=UPI0033A40F23